MAKIIIIGSVAWDEVVYLPQALRTGSHNHGVRRSARIGGGAANTALALALMGEREEKHLPPTPVLISAVGDGPEGEALLAALQSHGIPVDHIQKAGPHTTRSLVLLEADGERTVINLARARVPIPADLAHTLAACCYVRSADPTLTAIMAECIHHTTVIAHIPPLTPAFRPAHILLGSASDLGGDFLANPFVSGQMIAGESLEWVVITQGAQGAVAHGRTKIWQKSAPQVPVKDTTGAGDVFAAGLVFALASGEGMEAALATGVRWGSASVGYEGTVPVFPQLTGAAR